MQLNTSIKAIWVAALRSRRFYKCKGDLETDRDQQDHRSYYCCLGVLRKVALTDKIGADGGILTRSQAKEAGITTAQQRTLARMNDGTGKFVGKPKTFKQIADYIERYL